MNITICKLTHLLLSSHPLLPSVKPISRKDLHDNAPTNFSRCETGRLPQLETSKSTPSAVELEEKRKQGEKVRVPSFVAFPATSWILDIMTIGFGVYRAIFLFLNPVLILRFFVVVFSSSLDLAVVEITKDRAEEGGTREQS
jgi:hypothetical protein